MGEVGTGLEQVASRAAGGAGVAGVLHLCVPVSGRSLGLLAGRAVPIAGEHRGLEPLHEGGTVHGEHTGVNIQHRAVVAVALRGGLVRLLKHGAVMLLHLTTEVNEGVPEHTDGLNHHIPDEVAGSKAEGGGLLSGGDLASLGHFVDILPGALLEGTDGGFTLSGGLSLPLVKGDDGGGGTAHGLAGGVGGGEGVHHHRVGGVDDPRDATGGGEVQAVNACGHESVDHVGGVLRLHLEPDQSGHCSHVSGLCGVLDPVAVGREAAGAGLVHVGAQGVKEAKHGLHECGQQGGPHGFVLSAEHGVNHAHGFYRWGFVLHFHSSMLRFRVSFMLFAVCCSSAATRHVGAGCISS